MEAVRNVMSQLDPHQRPAINVLSVQDHKLRAVGFREVELHENEAVIFLAFPPTVPAVPGDEHRLPHDAVGVPHLPLLPETVILWGGRSGGNGNVEDLKKRLIHNTICKAAKGLIGQGELHS